MKNLAFVLVLSAVMAGCSSTKTLTGSGSDNVYQAQAEAARERQEKYVDRAIDKAPKWMSEVPKAQGVVYANGTAVSPDFSMADEKAKTIAFGKICMAAGGEVDKSSRVFRNDTSDASIENSEMAIRAMCRRVDITGVEVAEVKRISEGNRFRTYVLVALPIGDVNQLKKAKIDAELGRSTAKRSVEAFREMDADAKPAQ